MKSKDVYDLTKFTHLDYPNELACIVWFNNCNMLCKYCYNDHIVHSKEGNYSYEEILSFLKKRVGLLDGVVLSGGEATLKKLFEFCTEIKKLGFKIKLDTNGLNYEKIKELVEANLLDYIALDYKAPSYKFEQITNSKKFDQFEKTLQYLIKKEFDFEARTTVHADLLNEDDINEIIKHLYEIGYKKSYYIQEFMHTPSNLGNIDAPKNEFIRSKVTDLLTIVYR